MKRVERERNTVWMTRESPNEMSDLLIRLDRCSKETWTDCAMLDIVIWVKVGARDLAFNSLDVVSMPMKWESSREGASTSS